MNPKKPSGAQLYQILWRTERALAERGSQVLADMALGGWTEYAVLEILHDQGSLPINTIGRQVLLTSGSITAAIDRLERREWVRRQPGKHDRRVVEAHLTPAGRKIFREARAGHEQALETAAASLSTAERLQLLNLLHKLNARVDSLREEATAEAV